METFLKNKYHSWYYGIIDKVKSQDRILLKNNSSDYIYYENHHIIPRCLGGNNSKENLVLLTPREHFICHLLLTKFVVQHLKYKMFFALARMRHSSVYNYNRVLNSRQFAVCKEASRTAKKLSPKLTDEQESKRRMGIKNSWENSPERRVELSKRTSLSMVGVPKTEACKKKISNTLTGVKHDTERNIKKSQIQKKTWIIENVKGETFITKDRQLWCKENGYNDCSLSNLYKKRITKHKDIISICRL